MELNKLTLKDKKLFEQFFNQAHYELAVYAFQNLYIWKDLFEIKWAIIGDNLCVFFQDKIGCFLCLPPLGGAKDALLLEKAFAVMDKFNKNKEISRIENVEAKDAAFYKNLGFEAKIKSFDYICEREYLANLEGNKFKSKRACFNYFTKHNKFEYLPFSLRFRNSCIKLYNRWQLQRKARNEDPLYRGMLDDSKTCLKALLSDYQDLDILGRVIKIGKDLKAFTFGVKLNPQTFCILYEITDLYIKGLAQFIFRSFCCELKDYRYINIMDDTGLPNLKKVKLSYHPTRLIPAYIVKRKSGPSLS